MSPNFPCKQVQQRRPSDKTMRYVKRYLKRTDLLAQRTMPEIPDVALFHQQPELRRGGYLFCLLLDICIIAVCVKFLVRWSQTYGDIGVVSLGIVSALAWQFNKTILAVWTIPIHTNSSEEPKPSAPVVLGRMICALVLKIKTLYKRHRNRGLGMLQRVYVQSGVANDEWLSGYMGTNSDEYARLRKTVPKLPYLGLLHDVREVDGDDGRCYDIFLEASGISPALCGQNIWQYIFYRLMNSWELSFDLQTRLQESCRDGVHFVTLFVHTTAHPLTASSIHTVQLVLRNGIIMMSDEDFEKLKKILSWKM